MIATSDGSLARRATPDGMTWRSRAYLCVLILRHVGVGWLCFFGSRWFTSSSYNELRRVLPLTAWGVLLIAVGVQATIAAVTGNEWSARGALVASAGITLAWFGTFVMSAQRGELDAPAIPITWAAMAIKDLIVSAMPLRTPLEDALRRTGILE